MKPTEEDLRKELIAELIGDTLDSREGTENFLEELLQELRICEEYHAERLKKIHQLQLTLAQKQVSKIPPRF